MRLLNSTRALTRVADLGNLSDDDRTADGARAGADLDVHDRLRSICLTQLHSDESPIMANELTQRIAEAAYRLNELRDTAHDEAETNEEADRMVAAIEASMRPLQRYLDEQDRSSRGDDDADLRRVERMLRAAIAYARVNDGEPLTHDPSITADYTGGRWVFNRGWVSALGAVLSLHQPRRAYDWGLPFIETGRVLGITPQAVEAITEGMSWYDRPDDADLARWWDLGKKLDADFPPTNDLTETITYEPGRPEVRSIRVDAAERRLRYAVAVARAYTVDHRFADAATLVDVEYPVDKLPLDNRHLAAWLADELTEHIGQQDRCMANAGQDPNSYLRNLWRRTFLLALASVHFPRRGDTPRGDVQVEIARLRAAAAGDRG